jgi:hypothetical protein
MLNDDDYDPARLRKGQAIYDCGVLVQWVADLEERQGSSGRRDIFDLWKDMLDAGREGDGYGVADFRARLRPDSAVAVLMDGPGAERWAGIEARLTALGVTLEDRPDAGDYRRTALWHMARQHCTGSLGFFENPDGLQLETGERCGVLSGNPKIAAVEGHDPIAEAEAMFRAVQARCAAAAPVRYRTLEGRLIEAECKAEMVMPKVAAVGDAPPLATRAQ